MIRNKWAEDVKKVGIDLGDMATVPKMLVAPAKWPGVQAVFDGLMLLQEKISNGNREPAIVPPRELPHLAQIRKKEPA